jgi:uncharacterized RDD family membrane protein YckC
MDYIEIDTSQNVPIRFELASIGDRIVAFILDFLMWFVFLSLTFWLFVGVFGLKDDNVVFVFYLWVIPIIFFYSLAFEVFNNGRSIGKALLRLKVVRLDGKPCQMHNYLVRWMFRWIDIWIGLGSIGIIAISATERKQRLGDQVAQTTVIKIKRPVSSDLNALLKKATLEEYTPKYPEVRFFEETELLLAKEVIDRYQAYRNDAHKEAVYALAKVFALRLEVQVEKKQAIVFLQTLIKDFVVLTRS